MRGCLFARGWPKHLPLPFPGASLISLKELDHFIAKQSVMGGASVTVWDHLQNTVDPFRDSGALRKGGRAAKYSEYSRKETSF